MIQLVNYGDSDDDNEDQTQDESTADSQNSTSSTISAVNNQSSVSDSTSAFESHKDVTATSTVGDIVPTSTSSMALSICAAPDVVPMVNRAYFMYRFSIATFPLIFSSYY